jgi:hypothetical protein
MAEERVGGRLGAAPLAARRLLRALGGLLGERLSTAPAEARVRLGRSAAVATGAGHRSFSETSPHWKEHSTSRARFWF